jgi:predicted dehydrogenase
MTPYPFLHYGHTGLDAAFERGDVYDVGHMPGRAAKRPLQVAIAGCGGVAQAKWIPAIRRLQTIGEPVTILGIVDPVTETRRKVGALCAAPAFESLTALLAFAMPDLVVVAAADAAHTPLAEEAIAAGIACLVEKPLARDHAVARRLVGLAEARGTLLAAVANKRFSPPYALAKNLIEGGHLKSPPRLFTGKFTLGYPDVDLLEAGTVHLLDLLLWFMGPADRLHARAVHVPDGRLQSVIASLAFRSGAIGTLMTSAAGLSFKPWERVEVFGANAFLVVDDQYELALYDDEAGPAKIWRPAVPNTLMFDESFGGYAGLLENLLDAIRGLETLASPARDGAAAIGLIEAIRRSLARQADIDLSSEGLAS